MVIPKNMTKGQMRQKKNKFCKQMRQKKNKLNPDPMQWINELKQIWEREKRSKPPEEIS